MYFKSNEHLVPPIIQDKARELLTGRNPAAKENYAKQLEVIRDYCIMVLEQYQKGKS